MTVLRRNLYLLVVSEPLRFSTDGRRLALRDVLAAVEDLYLAGVLRVAFWRLAGSDNACVGIVAQRLYRGSGVDRGGLAGAD